MSGDTPGTAERTDATDSGILSMRDLAFSMLSVLVETAAARLHARVPLQTEDITHSSLDINEARAAIDAANALLESVRQVMEADARLAIESMLTQLQIDYVRQAGQR